MAKAAFLMLPANENAGAMAKKERRQRQGNRLQVGRLWRSLAEGPVATGRH